MKDYGEFYEDALFKKTLYPDFEGKHEAGARELVDKLLKQCGGLADLPKITTVVDIGCGEGTLLAKIKKCLEKSPKSGSVDENAPSINKWVGFDCSEKAIAQAKSKHAGTGIDFRKNDPEPDWEQIFAGLQVDWNCTALTCLSHSWFHIQNDQALRMAIKRFRPALLVIDLWHSCDETVERARLNTAFEEPLAIGQLEGSAGIYVLRTEKQGEDCIKRGICFRHAEGELRWLFETIQRLEDTSSLFGSRRELGKLDSALLAGSVTGADGCDYIMARQFHHLSGWGEMDCHALVPRDPIGKELNLQYFEVVRNIPKLFFVNAEGSQTYRHLRELLEVFDEANPTPERQARRMAGDRDVNVVLPFDVQRCFARALSLFESIDDTEIARYDFILELPNNFQLRFPTGYGHYQTLLSPVSSQQALLLSWAHDYAYSDVDTEYEKLETANLVCPEKITDTSFKTRRREGTDKHAFFLLPVYWGSLPMFVLVLKFPPRFPIASTDAHVYQAALQNLHRQIKLAFTHDFLSKQLLSPFVSRSLDALHKFFNPACNHAKEGVCEACNTTIDQKDDGKLTPNTCTYCRCSDCNAEGVSAHPGIGTHGTCERIEAYLNLIRKRLDGKEEWDADFEEDPLKLGGVLGGRWKSWLLTVPSIPIKVLESTKAENRVLIRLFRDEARRALLSHELRISYWFQEGNFFDAIAHEQWREDEHTNALNRMFTVAGVQDRETTRAKINEVAATGYFNRSFLKDKSHFLLEWTQSTLRKLLCGGLSDADKQLHFDDLKAAFCKTWENKGDGMRFAWRRLWAHLDAARRGSNASITPRVIVDKDTNSSWHKNKNGPDMRYFCTNDPTVLLGELCAALADMELLNSLSIRITEWTPTHDGGRGEGVVSFGLKSPLRKEIGGANCMRLRYHANLLWQLYGIGSDCDGWLYGHVILTIKVSVKQIEHALKFTLNPSNGAAK